MFDSIAWSQKKVQLFVIWLGSVFDDLYLIYIIPYLMINSCKLRMFNVYINFFPTTRPLWAEILPNSEHVQNYVMFFVPLVKNQVLCKEILLESPKNAK